MNHLLTTLFREYVNEKDKIKNKIKYKKNFKDLSNGWK